MKKKPIRIFKKNRFDFRNLKSKNRTEPNRKEPIRKSKKTLKNNIIFIFNIKLLKPNRNW